MSESVILVDENDTETGSMEKLMVHQLGLLHRAFSVFVFNTKGELLLQQRADNKYHSAGLWTNTCCSHPRINETIIDAVERRLDEEMGLRCKTDFIFSFTYKIKFKNGLTEHEFDHVYYGITDDLPIPERSEVKDYKYIRLDDLKADLILQPGSYTEWMKICLPKVIKHLKNKFMDNLINEQETV